MNDDLMSRSTIKHAIYDVCLRKNNIDIFEELLDRINELPSVNPQEPCEVSEYDKDHIWYKGSQYISLRRFLEVKALEQEPKTGHWIKDDITERSKSAYKHKCDRCGAYHRAMYDYCPSCGAKMVEPQESEDEE